MKTAFSALALGAMAATTLTAPATAQEAAPEAAMSPVSDAELENFIRAAATLKQVQESDQIAQENKQAAMVQVLQKAQMTPQRFNQIAAALETEADLQTRTQETIARLQAEAAG